MGTHTYIWSRCVRSLGDIREEVPGERLDSSPMSTERSPSAPGATVEAESVDGVTPCLS